MESPRVSLCAPIAIKYPSSSYIVVVVELRPDSAVVLAAGFGTRLRALHPPKPMILLSQPLIAYPLIALRTSGVSKVYVVANPWSRKYVEEFLDSIDFIDVEVEVLWRFWEENGSSMLLGLKRAFSRTDAVILTMSDHIFEPSLAIKAFSTLESCEVSIAADSRPRWTDIEEATKILSDGKGRAKIFGKRLENYDFVDTGVFAFRASVLSLIREAYEKGAQRVSEIMNYLAEKNKVCIADVTGSSWIDVDTIDELLFVAPKVAEEIARTWGVQMWRV